MRVLVRDGIRLIHETTDAIRWNASKNEQYQIKIPASALS
jgi:hypothetical protein